MSADDKPQVPKIDVSKPVVWTPEDASRFLTSAIHEAQRPLAEALKQRPITARALTVMVAIIVLAALIIALILSNQLEKAEKRAELNQAARDTLLAERHEISAKATTLEDRLNNAISEQRTLATTIDSLKGNEEILRKTQSDLARFRRQAELLRSQISGLEMEKAAIARQLEAIKALAMEDEEGLADDATPFDEYSQDAPIVSTPVTEFDADSGLFIIPESLPAHSPEAPADGAATIPAPTPEATREMVDEAAESVQPVTVDDPTPAEPETAVLAEPAVETATVQTAPVAEAPTEEPAATVEQTPEPTVEPVAETSAAVESDLETVESLETPVTPEPENIATPATETESPVTDADVATESVTDATVQTAPAESDSNIESYEAVVTFEDEVPTTTPTLTVETEAETAPAVESEPAATAADAVSDTGETTESAPAESTLGTDSAETTESSATVENVDSIENADTTDTADAVDAADTFTATAARYGDETAAPAEDVVEDTSVANENASSTTGTASGASILDEDVIGIILDREADSSTGIEPDNAVSGTPMGEDVPVIP